MQILVTREDVESDDRSDLINAVIGYLNGLFESFYMADEVPAEALYVYYTDYYLQQTNNGGISQFVYNSRLDPELIEIIKRGLSEMGAAENLEIFSAIPADALTLGADLKEFLDGDYFETRTDVRDFLGRHDERMFKIRRTEDLVALNHNYILKLPNLQICQKSEYPALFQQICDQVPDRENRRRQAEENEPEQNKNIKDLCQKAGQELINLNAGTFAEYNGAKVFEMHISTDAGHHYVILLEDMALLFNGTTRELVTEMAV